MKHFKQAEEESASEQRIQVAQRGPEKQTYHVTAQQWFVYYPPAGQEKET